MLYATSHLYIYSNANKEMELNFRNRNFFVVK